MRVEWLVRVICVYTVGALVTPVMTADSDKINTVHIIYQNHLDLGYTDSLTTVVNNYFNLYFPQAINTARTLRSQGWTSRYIYTTQPYLVSLYLDCPKYLRLIPTLQIDCPNVTGVAEFRKAVDEGIFAWHAGAFNAEAEQSERSLYKYFLSISTSLDKEFNKTHSRVLSQRDVPGLTIAALSLLNEAGVQYVSLGINGGSAAVDVPRISLWRDPRTDAEVVLAYHPHGYPDNPGLTPAEPGGMARGDCLQVPGLACVLCWGFKTDNTGSHTVKDVFHIERMARAAFPEAKTIQASTYDAFFQLIDEKVDRLENIEQSKHTRDRARTHTYIPAGLSSYTPSHTYNANDYLHAASFASPTTIRQSLPVVYREMGDTWVFGIQSDPLKIAKYRALARARKTCIKKNLCNPLDLSDRALQHYSRALIKNFEHTWGFHSLSPGDVSSHNNSHFRPLVDQRAYNQSTNLWFEQRAFNDWAVDALPSNHALLPFVLDELNQLQRLTATPSIPDVSSSEGAVEVLFETEGAMKSFEVITHTCGVDNPTRSWRIAFSSKTGAIHHLTRPNNSYNWASDTHPLALVVYQTYDQNTMNKVCESYSPARWCAIEKSTCSNAQRKDWMPTLQQLWVETTFDKERDRKKCIYRAFITYPQEVVDNYGAPERTVLSMTVHLSSSHNTYGTINEQKFHRKGKSINMAYVDESGNGNGTEKSSGRESKSASSKKDITHSQSIHVSENESETGLQVVVQMESKGVTRNPESISIVFRPRYPTPSDNPYNAPSQLRDIDAHANNASLEQEEILRGESENGSNDASGDPWDLEWFVDKLGMDVGVRGLFTNGSHNVHGVWDGAVLKHVSNSQRELFRVRPLDSGLALPVTTTDTFGSVLFNPIKCGLQQSEVTGMAFNLFNNLWDTNYILYYPFAHSRADNVMGYRFLIDFED
eukprot:CFRG5275T1